MTRNFVIATAAGQRVALDAKAVEAIIRAGALVPVPRAPAHIAGLCAVRSTVMTVIDIARAAGRTVDADSDHAAVVLHDGHRYALQIDRVLDVEDIDALPVPNDASIGSGWLAIAPSRIETAEGVALLLDIGAVIAGGSRD